MTIVLNIGIILSFFLGFLLFMKKNRVLTDNILLVWLFVIGIHLSSYLLYNLGYWDIYPHLIGITVPFPFFYGPLLYLYVIYSFRNREHLRKVDYLHFVPVFASYLYLIPFYFFYSAEEKIKVDKGILDDYSLFSNLMIAGFILSGVSYSILSYRKLVQRNKVIDENFSSHRRINLKWLRFVIIGIASVFITVAIISVLRKIFGFQFPFNADILFYAIVVLFVGYIGYSGILQQDLFSNTIENELQLVKAKSEYKNSGLKAETAVIKHKELLKLMENEKPYLNPKLTLQELSEKLEISSNNLSQIINQYEKINFHDFVNKYRVEEFKKQSVENPHFNILALALEAGFNSKSSFNQIFKRQTGKTPSQYISGL